MQSCSSLDDAFELHSALFASGLERILLTLRSASVQYYPMLHLEIARYLASARLARFNLGSRILSYLDERYLDPEERQIVARMRITTSKSGAPQLGNVF